jgi:hypothetical protein
MLNISDHNKHIDTHLDRFKQLKDLKQDHTIKFKSTYNACCDISVITLSLPWTHIWKGAVTTLKPNQRPINKVLSQVELKNGNVQEAKDIS